jgi:long-chain acyl-CoA synthetase
MYTGTHVNTHPDRPAFIMASTGETVTYRELDARSNRLAHLLRALGLQHGGHYAIYLENHPRFIESCAAGARAGLYYTCVNSFLTADELAYILENSESTVLITSRARLDVALQALAQCPQVTACIVVDGPGDGHQIMNLDAAVAGFPDTPIAD